MLILISIYNPWSNGLNTNGNKCRKGQNSTNSHTFFYPLPNPPPLQIVSYWWAERSWDVSMNSLSICLSCARRAHQKELHKWPFKWYVVTKMVHINPPSITQRLRSRAPKQYRNPFLLDVQHTIFKKVLKHTFQIIQTHFRHIKTDCESDSNE